MLQTINPPAAQKPVVFSAREAANYSLSKALFAAADKSKDAASFERELSIESWKRAGRPGDCPPDTVIVPYSVLFQRDVNVATGGAGGYLVSTDLTGTLDAFRPRGILDRLGATFLTGLQGNATLTRQPGAATAYWLETESSTITEGNQTFAQISLTPKTVGAYTEISYKLQKQSAFAERVVRRDLASVVLAARDAAALNGSGSLGQPQGIIGTGGIGGFTGASIDWAAVVNAQADVATANALGDGRSFAYVTTPAVAELLAKRQGFSTTAPIWLGPLAEGTVAGARAISTTGCPSATIVAGNWSELLVGEWGSGIEVRVNGQANFQAGIIGIACFYTCDFALADAGAFTVASSVS